MKYLNYLNEKIQLIDKYQVIIIGGGTSGSTAAIASARMGADTLLIEREGSLGGTSTLGLVVPMMPIKMEGNPDSSAINKEIKAILHETGDGATDSNGNDGWFNPEMLKFILESLYLKYNGDLLYNTEFIKPIVEGEKIKGVIVHNKDGLKAYHGEQFIDSTGDADLAFSAGVPCKSGIEEKKYQALTLRFIVANIDLKVFSDYLATQGQDWGLDYPLLETAMIWNKGFALENVFKKALSKGDLKREDGNYFQAFSIPGMPGTLAFNCPEIPYYKNSLDPYELTKARIKGRKMIIRLFNFFKKYFKGFNDSYIASQAVMLGVRESRRIVGQYVLDQDDYLTRKKFKDVIAKSAYPIDIHGESLEIDTLKRGKYYEIPFRTLVPKKIKNLFVTGRAISTTFNAQSAVRIQPVCKATGEAAGIAAAKSAKEKLLNNQVDGAKIKKQMLDWGADI